MASNTLDDETSADADTLLGAEEMQLVADQRSERILSSPNIVAALLPLASLRLTVALFAMSIFLIFAGTLAQVDQDIWEVMRQYFRTYIAWIPFQVFFPKSFFSGAPPQIPGSFPFPGGFTIGALMGINLLAAHILRFKVQARGGRLAAGLGVIALGAVLVWMVVVGGSGKDTIEGAAPLAWSTLWATMKWSLVALWVAAGYALYRIDRSRKLEVWSLILAVAGLGALVLWVFAQGNEVLLGDSSLRILWQLIKGGLAGLVLLAGCILVFRKRAGIVLLHSGIALVMANELVVHNLHVEGQMRLREGETVDFVQDVRAVELAVVDPSNAKTDDVVVVPRSFLKPGETIHDAALPFDVETLEYLTNSQLKRLVPGDKNRATAGAGLQWIAEPRRAGAGTDVGGKVDIAAAYVQLIDKTTHRPIGTYLISLELLPQKVEVGGKTYDLALRFKRTYKPYSMRLADVRFDKYMGTMTPSNYSSDLRLVDKSRNVDRDVHIWMNNPLRFAGETFYQSGFDADEQGHEATTLAVVSNTGWMIPYVACMLVATGMLAQFSMTLGRFLRRRSDASPSDASGAKKPRRGRVVSDGKFGAIVLFPAAVVLACAAWVISSAREPQPPVDQMQLEEFGRLPIVFEGRVKPFDTLARTTLRQISERQTFVDESGQKQPAIKWLLDVITRSPDAFKHKVFRITNLEVLNTLGLERRSGFRYSIDEFHEKIPEFERQAALATQVEKDDPARLNIYQKKILELDHKIRLMTRLMAAFETPQIRDEHLQEDLMEAMHRQQELERMQPPLAVPPKSDEGKWEPYTVAITKGFAEVHVLNRQPNPATVAWNSMFAAYRKGDAKEFNTELAKYETFLGERKPKDYDSTKVNFEAFYNHFEPLFRAEWLYVVAFVLTALGWLGWTAPLNRAAFWLLAFIFGVHTFAIIAGIYISGRPPVTNLYSSAVFIGWAVVLFGLVMEIVYRMGIGNVIAAAGGFATLEIARNLATSGDTFIVLQAVLDTQFWLATHVTCITLGYATTYVAGALGVLYVIRGVLTPSLSPETGKELSRMIYGSLCFAMFFSFVGTVLGGLWADDSWGRFWGWDPKENGALIIVLWNALVLHARWGGMVKERGTAALVVVGNIVTSWSWWGVNELGVGLHSYGFTEGVLLALGLFIASQLAIVGLALVPRELWWSGRRVVASGQ